MTESIILLVVVIIVIQIIKELSNKKILSNKKQYKQSEYKQNKEKGNNYEKIVCNHYINKGYIVDERGGFNDGGIDLIAHKKNETLLIQCKNWSTNHKYKVREKEVKEFYGACNFYIEENNINRDIVLCIYAVPNHEIIIPNAKGIFKKHYKNCRYEVIKDNHW